MKVDTINAKLEAGIQKQWPESTVETKNIGRDPEQTTLVFTVGPVTTTAAETLAQVKACIGDARLKKWVAYHEDESQNPKDGSWKYHLIVDDQTDARCSIYAQQRAHENNFTIQTGQINIV